MRPRAPLPAAAGLLLLPPPLGAGAATGDRVTGTAGDDVPAGTARADTLRGRGGDDARLGRGPDRCAVSAVDGAADTVRCGPGEDVVLHIDVREPDPVDTFRGCERFEFVTESD